MPSVDLELLDKLVRDHRIRFFDDLPSTKWPTRHKKTLGRAVELGGRKFESFAIDSNTADDEPWKLQVKSQAILLAEKARRSRQRNESSWRFACEPLVFARLEAEVVCKNCRKRVWRSEIEASREESTALAHALKRRQRKREPCRCPRMGRSQDHLEAVGLNNIFGHREDEQVRLDKTVASQLKKNILKPDTIFGLRQTRNIENLLYDTRNRELDVKASSEGRQLHELLHPSPLVQPISQKGDMLLFPFLVLEAKSSTSDSDWFSIQRQTAFPLKVFLDTQNRLRTATGRRSKWRAGPMVWFFANKGEDWRLSAACIEQRGPNAGTAGALDYQVIELWRGSITTRDGALQLLLLVDYIFDWARDVYRDDIIQELRILASGENDAASAVYSDTEIHSTRELAPSSFSGQGDYEQHKAYISLVKGYTALDSDRGVFRHATFIESRYCAIVVTSDNVHTLLQSTKPTRTQQLCRLILSHMKDSIILDRAAIDAMEEQWTGNSRLSPPRFLSPINFYSVISSTNYLSGSWHQVRELSVVAIAEDAWDTIVDASKLKQNRGNAARPPVVYQALLPSLLTQLKQLQAGSPADAILASIVRRAVKIRCNFFTRTRSLDTSSDAVSVGSRAFSPGLCIVVPDSGVFRDITHYIYKSFKKGNLEPQEPFMRVSKRFDQQHLLQFDVEPFLTREAPLQVSNSGCVLISSACHIHDPERSKSEICVYIVEGEPVAPDGEQLFEGLLDTIETRDVYHTTQDNGTSNLTSINGVPWNIEKPYGIYSGPFEFLHLLLKMGADLGTFRIPFTQGSLRTSAETGSYLYKRNLNPWHDPRRLGGEVAGRMFIIYKLMSSEVLFWRMLAEQREAGGNPCCHICVTPQDGRFPTCAHCTLALWNSNSQRWFRNILQGISPFPEEDEEEDSDESEDTFEGLDFEYRKDRWRENLARYPKLDESFKNLYELRSQWKTFRHWANAEKDDWWKRIAIQNKRRRGDTESEEGQDHIDSEKSE